MRTNIHAFSSMWTQDTTVRAVKTQTLDRVTLVIDIKVVKIEVEKVTVGIP